jgi:hypothetical protein
VDFSIKHDGLERTSWFPFSRYTPERDGYYEIRPWKGAPDTRCEWREDQWWTTDRLAHRLEVFDWRGLTESAYREEVTKLQAPLADA